MKRLLAATLLWGLCAATAPGAEADRPLLLQKPALGKGHIAFVYAGDLWLVGKDGGEARLPPEVPRAGRRARRLARRRPQRQRHLRLARPDEVR